MNHELANPPFNRISGPYPAGDLSVYLVHGPDRCDAQQFNTLAEALSRKVVVVHETGSVGRLEIENLSNDKDLLVVAGEIVKGGRQDRTLGVDLVVPRASRLPIPAFCVESQRWARRRGEDVASFSGSSSMLTKIALMEAKLGKSQSGVWSSVAETHGHLSGYLKDDVASPVSPSSYQLMMEHPRMKALVAEARERLSGLLDSHPDVVGFVFVTHGRISTADVFATRQMARSYFDKFLEAALVDVSRPSRGARRRTVGMDPGAQPQPDAPDMEPCAVSAWLQGTIAGELLETQLIAPRVRLESRRSRDHHATYFGSLDEQLGVLLHQNWMSN